MLRQVSYWCSVLWWIICGLLITRDYRHIRMDEFVIWREVTEKVKVFFVLSLKFLHMNGGTVETIENMDDSVEVHPYLVIVHIANIQCPCLVATNILFFDVSNYVEVKFE